jgi:hypothetical protein
MATDELVDRRLLPGLSRTHVRGTGTDAERLRPDMLVREIAELLGRIHAVLATLD